MKCRLKQGINPVFKSADIGLSQKNRFLEIILTKSKRHYEKSMIISIVRYGWKNMDLSESE